MSKNFNDHSQYGERLWEEPIESLRNRIRTGVLIGITLFIMGSLLVPIGLEFYSNMFLPTAGFLFVCGFITIILGLSPLPLKIHEEGILISNRLFGYRHFIPRSQIAKFHESKPLFSTLIVFKTVRGASFEIKKDLPGLEDTIYGINFGSMDDDRYESYNEENIKTQKKLEMWVYVLSILAALLLMLTLIVASFEPSFNLVNWLTIIGLGVSFISLILVGLALFELLDWRSKFSINLRINTGHFIVFILLANLIFFSANLTEYTGIATDYIPIGEFRQHPPPDNFWEGGPDLINGTFNVDDVLYVPDGSQYVISNSLIVFRDEEDLGIYVEKGGHLIVENSTISSANNEIGYWFEVYGELTVSDSTIQYLWGDPENENMDGGIELHWAKARFERSTIQFSQTNGIMARNSSLYISSCSIENCVDDGIELRSTSAIIKDSEFRYNGWPIIFWDHSDAIVSNCTFDSNDEGLYIIESSPTIENCTFLNTGSGPAVTVLGWRSKPVFTNNIFHNNEVDIEKPAEPALICSPIILPVVSAILYGMVYYRNNKIEEDVF
jgi:parallel beta-helix repeat protein